MSFWLFVLYKLLDDSDVKQELLPASRLVCVWKLCGRTASTGHRVYGLGVVPCASSNDLLEVHRDSRFALMVCHECGGPLKRILLVSFGLQCFLCMHLHQTVFL